MKLFKNTIVSVAVALTAVAGLASGAAASEGGTHAKEVDWSFNGAYGKYDKASAQRGFQVFREVCSSCHSLKYFKFRNLADIGYGEDMIKAFAAEYEVPGDIDDEGEETVRAGLPQDGIPAPFPNENAARASNGGAFPPDLSLIMAWMVPPCLLIEIKSLSVAPPTVSRWAQVEFPIVPVRASI